MNMRFPIAAAFPPSNTAFRQWDFYSNSALIVLGLVSFFYLGRALRKPGPKPRILWAGLFGIVILILAAVVSLLRLPPAP